jgi:hypothetical protein
MLLPKIATAQAVTVIKNGKAEIRRVSTIILDFGEEAGVFWDSENGYFISGLSEKYSGKEDIKPEGAKNYVNFIFPEGKKEIANIMMSYVRTPQGKLHEKGVKAQFNDVVFRRDSVGQLVPGVITTNGSEVYILPKIMNIPLGVLPTLTGEINFDKISPSNWPFKSSTDVTISEGPFGSLKAKGRIEFLLLGKMMNPFVNFGEGTRLKFTLMQSFVELVDSDGKVNKVKEGEFLFSNQKWGKIKNEGNNPIKTLVGKIVDIDTKKGDIVVQVDDRKITICDIYHYFGEVSEGLQVTCEGADFSARLRNFKEFRVGDSVEIAYQEGQLELKSMKKIKKK